MRAAGIPVGAVRTVPEAFLSKESEERRIVSEIPHPSAGTIPNIASVFRHMSLTPSIDPVHAPLLGQHTEQVLKEVIGYDDDHILRLRKAGVFGGSGAAASEE
jgi:crotonobetainyl-CoA:carnitine CoA-transferase CaiB-like acyl-CoA transferase